MSPKTRVSPLKWSHKVFYIYIKFQFLKVTYKRCNQKKNILQIIAITKEKITISVVNNWHAKLSERHCANYGIVGLCSHDRLYKLQFWSIVMHNSYDQLTTNSHFSHRTPSTISGIYKKMQKLVRSHVRGFLNEVLKYIFVWNFTYRSL